MENNLDLIIKGDLVLENGLARNCLVGIKNGLIVGLYSAREKIEVREFLDFKGLLIFPGVIDAHVHSYSIPGIEGFKYSTKAAAAGGVTTIIEMPYDAGNPITNPGAFQRKVKLIEEEAFVDVALLATLKKDGSKEMINPLLELGACGFKLSLFETDPERFPHIPDGVLWEILPILAEAGITVGFHAEDDELIFSLIDKFQKSGDVSPPAHCATRPPASETIAVLKLLELAFWIKFPLHIYHVSAPRSGKLIQFFRQQGVDVTWETCPHYLLLNVADMSTLRGKGKINPPLRDKQAVAEMWELLKNGEVDIISSDHAPWPLEKKQDPNIFANASGAPGVETLLPLMFSEGVKKRGLSPVHLAQVLATKPARRFGLYPRKGHIALGADADLTVIDPQATWIIQEKEMHSSAKWTPFAGFTIQGKIVRTILRGKVVYDGQEVIAEPGYGQFIARLQ